MSQFDTLLTLQEHDTHADQLRHRRASLPERDRLASQEGDRDQIAASMADLEGRRHALVKEQQRREDEIALLEDKITKVDNALYSGATANPRELQALQEDLEGMRKRRSLVEDEVLDLMEQIEPLDTELAELGGRRDEVAADVEATRTDLAQVEAEIDGELADVDRGRAETEQGISADLLDEYRHLRGRYGGVGAARLVGNRCNGCHLTMAAAELERVKRQPPEAIAHCEECGRILVR